LRFWRAAAAHRPRTRLRHRAATAPAVTAEAGPGLAPPGAVTSPATGAGAGHAPPTGAVTAPAPIPAARRPALLFCAATAPVADPGRAPPSAVTAPIPAARPAPPVTRPGYTSV